MMKRKGRNTCLLITIILFSVVWLLHIAIHSWDFFAYRYFRFGDPALVREYIVWTVIVPLAFLILSSVAAFWGKKVLVGVIGIAYILALSYAFFPLSALQLYTPLAYSYTDDPGHYGAYDQYVEAEIAHSESGFPRELPEGAAAEDYFYWYMNAAANHYCVILSAQYSSEDAYQTEISRLRQYGYELSPAKSVYQKPTSSGDYLKLVIDWDAKRIVYFFYCDGDSIIVPNSLEEYDSTNYSEKMILQSFRSDHDR